VGSGFEPHWRPQPAKLPSFGGYSLETLPYWQADRDVNLMQAYPYTYEQLALKHRRCLWFL